MSKNNSRFNLTQPDVLVIGGGTAGIAAAAGAHRQGASVTLLEKNSFAGGKSTAAYVGTLCGLYFRSENSEPQFAQQGFPKEFAQQLALRSGTQPLHFKHGLYFLPYDYFQMLLLCDEWLKKTTQSVCFNATVIKAVSENQNVKTVDAWIGNQLIQFQPASVVDTSGENLLSELLNFPSVKSDQYQAAAHVFCLSAIQENDDAVLSFSLIRTIRKGIETGLLESFFERVSIVPGSHKNKSVYLKLPLPVLIDENTKFDGDLESLSRKAINDLYMFLKSNSETFCNSYISFVAPEVGIRTGPRHEGKHLLSGDDVLNATKHTDTIARGAWPVESWMPGKSVAMEFFELNDYYDIPAGALQSKYISNLFFGGRNISADDKAIASARVIGTCLATGFAAGTLAAFNSFNRPLVKAITQVQLLSALSYESHENH